MLTCDGCLTTLYLQDDRLLNAGQSGEMHDSPLLFGLGDRVRFGKTRVDILGHARFSYGRGWWDEFWGMDRQGNGVWVSVDEGDVVVQRALPDDDQPNIARSARIGQETMFQGMDLRVTERDSATCIAVRGSFDETLFVGQTYDFLNLEGPDGLLVSGEFSDDGEIWFAGEWFDPFEVEIGVAA